MNELTIDSAARQTCADILQRIADDPELIAGDERLKGLITKIYRSQRKTSRRAEGERCRAEDRSLRATTAVVRRDALKAPFAAALPIDNGAVGASVGSLNRAVACYICKIPFNDVHFFYHRLCPACAALNYEKRRQRADLTDRIALLTGGRIKIGFQIALRLLRDGARVILTTRFPGDAASRFQKEIDFDVWQGRLRIVALDLRNLPDVEAFCDSLLRDEPWLDIIINNAAQTVKRPLAFYKHLLDTEREPPVLLEARAAALGSAQPKPLSLVSGESELASHFPAGMLDADGQQVDARPVNSWALRLHEVSTREMVEAQLVNAAAPFLLCSRLKPALLRSPHARRFVINVSAMEGQFNRASKTVYHPHTNMAKAALNMLTRTSAADYARAGIYMNSVDTGWITDENPLPKHQYMEEVTDFHTPLDAIDGMARIYDPIVTGLADNGEPLFYGHFLKDYFPYAW